METATLNQICVTLDTKDYTELCYTVIYHISKIFLPFPLITSSLLKMYVLNCFMFSFDRIKVFAAFFNTGEMLFKYNSLSFFSVKVLEI